VTTIAVYKLTSLSREEIEAMLDLEIKETKVYKEIKEEGREEGEARKAIAVAKELLAIAMEPQKISQITQLPLEQVLALQKPGC
jgi:predicted transposase YdaD